MSSVPVTVIRSKTICAPFSPSGADRFDVAVLLGNLRAQMFEARQMKIDGPRADRAAAGQGNARASGARHQRPEHQARGAHRLHQFVGRFGRNDSFRVEDDALGVLVVDGYLRADVDQQPLHRADIAHARDAFEHDLFVGQQRGGQRRQCGVFRAAGGDRAVRAARRLQLQIYPFLFSGLLPTDLWPRARYFPLPPAYGPPRRKRRRWLRR